MNIVSLNSPMSVRFKSVTQKNVEVRCVTMGGGFFRAFLNGKSPMRRSLKEADWTPVRVTNYNDPGAWNSITSYIS